MPSQHTAMDVSSSKPNTKPQGLMDSRWAPRQTSSVATLNEAGGRGKSLADSRWAPRRETLELKPKKVFTVDSSTLPPFSCSSSLPPSQNSSLSSTTSYHSACSHLSTSSSTSSISARESPEPSLYPSTRSSSRVSSNEASKMYQAADLDDTAGFMAAARALVQKRKLSKDKDASGSVKAKSDSKSSRRSLSPCAPEFVPSSSSSSSSLMSNFNPNAEEFVPIETNPAKGEIFDSAQDAAQEFGLDAGLNESAKDNVPSKSKITTDVNDTAGFMAAARARFYTSGAEKAVDVSSKSVNSTQGTGLDDFETKNTAIASTNKTVESTKETGLNDSDVKSKVSALKKIVNAAQGSGLDEYDVKNRLPAFERKMTTNVNDTAGFMDAARAWKSRNVSPIYTQANVRTPGQLNDHGQESKTQKTSSLSKESIEPSFKVKKESIASRFNVFPEKPPKVDDTVGFMAAARALRCQNMPSTYNQAVAKTPDQLSNHSDCDKHTQQTPPSKEHVEPAKMENIPGRNDISDGILSSEPVREKAFQSSYTVSRPKPANIDDAAGFMAAARARNLPSVYTQDAAKTPDQMSDDKKQTQLSPIKDFFATPTEKASGGNDISGDVLGSEVSNTQTYETPHENMSVASPKKPAIVDDTAGFMAAVRALKSRSVSPTIDAHTAVRSSYQASSGHTEQTYSPVGKVPDGDGPTDTGDDSGFKKSYPVITKSPRESTSMSTVSPIKHDINDTAGFMSAARRLTGNPGMPNIFAGVNNPNSSSDVGTKVNSTTNVEAKKEAVFDAVVSQTLSADSAKYPRSNDGARAKQLDLPASGEQYEKEPYKGLEKEAKKQNSPPERATTTEDKDEEDRENLITFKTWGTPTPRDKPPAQVRRIILTGLPPAWANPSKALSLVHTGAIDKINISPSGNAHIYFCDHNACEAFFDKYPNGIGIGSHNVYVERGTEVDIVSSQLAINRSAGATRVIQAAGVEMDATMAQLYQIASGQNRRVEKIVDSYIPGEARIVQFRFCCIDDAVRFRSRLTRMEDWEACNVQYGKDPCELVTGPHIA